MKKYGETFSEEILNALADQQFSPNEQAEMLQQIKNDEEAATELYQLRNMKASVQLAYAEPTSPPQSAKLKTSMRIPLAIAATVLLLIGSAVMLQYSSPLITTSSADRVVLLDPQGKGQRPAKAEDEEMRVVFHVQNIRQVSAGELLDEVESLMLDFFSRGETVRVEVVAHSDGLGLLRSKLTTESDRIARMVRDYPMLTFVACQNTINRLKVEKGIEVVLIPDVVVTESGVAYVVRRQKEGWVYIQV
ncbi:MAG: hypothetical protein LC541_11650 [Candidatus Thiodiazotropha sp.]|nr:hypothetical protein [Candidatus Thiodiazotropha sp.]MCM8883929.1 hypothetical protein [Candidatus Thiodiazotropha sp.]MCM8920829.1 hypothetical protein [Candidatus Thiodiazotropha sp.]